MSQRYLNEPGFIDSSLNIEISPSIFLQDLLILEKQQELRYDFIKTYVRSLTRNSAFSLKESLSELKPNTVALLQDWTLLLFSDSLLIISLIPKISQTSRVNFEKFLKHAHIHTAINSISLIADSGFTYVITYIFKVFLSCQLKIKDLTEISDFYSIKSLMQQELTDFVFETSHFTKESILKKIEDAKLEYELSKFDEDFEETDEKSDKFFRDLKHQQKFTAKLTIFAKPICEPISISSRPSITSLEYTDTEETGKQEISFRLSNTITSRFPRFSGSSIGCMDTPSKDTKKSYAEYAEFMESPHLSNNTSPNKFSTTPINSPKQSSYTIQEVKNFLLPEPTSVEKASPPEKAHRGQSLRTFNFKSAEFKPFNTEFFGSPESKPSRTAFEEKKMSCHCQSCSVF